MGKRISGIAASDGIAIGKAKKFFRKTGAVSKRTLQPSEVEAEKQRFDCAIEACGGQLEKLIAFCGQDERAEILRAHLTILQDPFLREQATDYIGQGYNAEHALTLAVDAICGMFSQLDDEIFRARAADFRDVSARILRQLQGVFDEDLSNLTEPVIVITKDLSPSDTAAMDAEYILGFATELGGKTSHTAIIARGLDIPAVVGTGDGLFDAVSDGDLLILDGSAGLICILPLEKELNEYQLKQRQLAQLRQELAGFRDLPAITLDGKQVTIAANIGSEKEAQNAIANGAEGIGLFRTEFLYMDSDHWPTEEEQFAAYHYVLRHMQGRPVIIRTLDIGGDKKLPYYEFDYEENPFLGRRAIRFCLDRTDIFKTQLRAILRASAFGKILVMLPMVISLDEIAQARALVAECMSELRHTGEAFDSGLQIGIMIETPAAVLQAAQLAKKADFFSIGTNDLTQYILAVDRGNEKVQKLYDPFHPAVLAAIRHVISAGHEAGIWVGMCGEFASNEMATQLLLGMGIDEFSVSPARVSYIKKVICSASHSDAVLLADKVLASETVGDVLRCLIN